MCEQLPHANLPEMNGVHFLFNSFKLDFPKQIITFTMIKRYIYSVRLRDTK